METTKPLLLSFKKRIYLEGSLTCLNYKCGSNVQTGGYGGWVIIRQNFYGNANVTTKVKYYHGSGGGGCRY
jgi:hypothetical protein